MRVVFFPMFFEFIIKDVCFLVNGFCLLSMFCMFLHVFVCFINVFCFVSLLTDSLGTTTAPRGGLGPTASVDTQIIPKNIILNENKIFYAPAPRLQPRRQRSGNAPATPRERQLGPSRRRTQQEPFASRSREKHALFKNGVLTKKCPTKMTIVET